MKLIKNNLMLASGLVLLVISAASCKKSFLEKVPIGGISENTLLTKHGVEGMLIGTYSILNGTARFNANDFNNGISNSLVANIASDEAKKGCIYPAGPEWDAIENYTVNPTMIHIADRWKSIYTGVHRANETIRLLNKLPEGVLTDEEAVQVLAEARFLRGVYHFEAVKLWRRVPYIDESVVFGADDIFKSNETIPWASVEADFEFAGNNLSTTKANIGRANKWAARSFLAKIYMFQNKWTEAKPVLEDVIANGVTSNGTKYRLVDKYGDTWNPRTKNSSESVFAVQMAAVPNDGGYNGFAGEALTTPVPYGGNWYQPSFNLVNSFKTDAVKGLPLLTTFNDVPMHSDMGVGLTDPFTPYAGTIDARLDWTVGRRGIPYLDWGVFDLSYLINQDGGPYCHMKSAFWEADKATSLGSFEGWAFVTSTNYTMIRFADVLLWAAECEVEIGSLAKAEEYVNLVRARAANPDGFVKTYISNNNPQGGFTNTPAANYFVGLYNGEFAANGKEFARESVRFERKLEFGMEGHRIFDLQRYDLQQPGYMGNLLDKYNADENRFYMELTGQPYLITNGHTFPKGKSEVLPIPQREIDLSVVDGASVLKQNPGY
ncbi:MAG: RagB/SusD family nutrient uptake outer membrane protein [Chitinophagaceae bacterium]|nr:RagB/SusD family nutrient uptake outer membrane protein [Chitinophagaceae bacterium]